MFDLISSGLGVFGDWFNKDMKIVLGVVPMLLGMVIVYLRNRKSGRWFSFKDVVVLLALLIAGFALLVGLGFIEAG